MTKATIAVDIDDVLFVNAFRVVRSYNAKYGTNIYQPVEVEEGVISKGTLELLCEHTGLSVAEITNRVEELIADPDFHDIEPIEDASEVLRLLSERYRLVAVSARPRVMTRQSTAWVGAHFSGVFDNVHIIGDRWGGGVLVDKSALLQQEQAAYLVDDLPKNVIAANRSGIQGILFGDYYWNELSTQDAKHVVRCKDWRAVQEYFRE